MFENNSPKHDDFEFEQESARDEAEVELETEEEVSSDKIKTLRDKLKACESEKKAMLDEQQRQRADFLNSKRRNVEQLVRDRERITERILLDFLPLLDSFDTALQGEDNTYTDAWKKGVVAMHAQFISLLKSYDINEIETVGKPFNPHEHEAVGSREPRGEEMGDVIVQVIQKGYKRNGNVIRPAKVIITA